MQPQAKFCPQCRMACPLASPYCPACGTAFTQFIQVPDPARRKISPIVIVTGLLLTTALFCCGLFAAFLRYGNPEGPSGSTASEKLTVKWTHGTDGSLIGLVHNDGKDLSGLAAFTETLDSHEQNGFQMDPEPTKHYFVFSNPVAPRAPISGNDLDQNKGSVDMPNGWNCTVSYSNFPGDGQFPPDVTFVDGHGSTIEVDNELAGSHP